MILQYLFCHVLAYGMTANSVCLHLLVPPLALCYFFDASVWHIQVGEVRQHGGQDKIKGWFKHTFYACDEAVMSSTH